jgi:hypothetical protein
MANWQPVDGSFVGQAIDETSTTQKVELGRRIKCLDVTLTNSLGFGEFVYLKGVASTAVGTAVTYTRGTASDAASWVTTRTAANAKGPIAFAMSANVASQYGWYQIFGTCAVKVLASFASGNVPYLPSTAGSLDDAVVVGDEVYTATSVSAIDTPSTGLALISVSYPYVSDASN